MDPASVPKVRLHNGVEMPQVGLGVWKMDDATVQTAITAALEAGYRMIDTAPAYHNEPAVGKAITTSGVPREQLFVTSKLWNDSHDYDAALRAFDATMNDLGLDYLDLYLIHWPQPKQHKFVEAWRALEKLYADKRVRAIGVSNFTSAHLAELMANSKIVPMVNQIELHPKFQQVETAAFCLQKGIAIEAYSPLMHGGEVLEDPLIVDMARAYHRSPAQIILRWHTQRKHIVIPKSGQPGRIRENINIFDFELSADDMAHIDAMDASKRIGADPDARE